MSGRVLAPKHCAETRRFDYCEPRWYAAQTRSRHEKSAFEQLTKRGIRSFLPLYEKTSRWKDRRVRLQIPLFAGYVFVKMAWRDRLEALRVPGLVRFVSFDGSPAAISDIEIESIQRCSQIGLRVDPTSFPTIGQQVRIHSGPLEGCEGILLRRKGQLRLVLSVHLIQRSVAIDVEASDVVPATSIRTPTAAKSLNCD